MHSYSKVGNQTRLSNLVSGIKYIPFYEEFTLLKNKFFRVGMMLYTLGFNKYSLVIEWLKERRKLKEEKNLNFQKNRSE